MTSTTANPASAAAALSPILRHIPTLSQHNSAQFCGSNSSATPAPLLSYYTITLLPSISQAASFYTVADQYNFLSPWQTLFQQCAADVILGSSYTCFHHDTPSVQLCNPVALTTQQLENLTLVLLQTVQLTRRRYHLAAEHMHSTDFDSSDQAAHWYIAMESALRQPLLQLISTLNYTDLYNTLQSQLPSQLQLTLMKLDLQHNVAVDNGDKPALIAVMPSTASSTASSVAHSPRSAVSGTQVSPTVGSRHIRAASNTVTASSAAAPIAAYSPSSVTQLPTTASSPSQLSLPRLNTSPRASDASSLSQTSATHVTAAFTLNDFLKRFGYVLYSQPEYAMLYQMWRQQQSYQRWKHGLQAVIWDIAIVATHAAHALQTHSSSNSSSQSRSPEIVFRIPLYEL